MTYIQKDEQYDWMGSSDKQFADAEIPKELADKLWDALTHYNNVCRMIDQYIENHSEALLQPGVSMEEVLGVDNNQSENEE